MVLLISTLAPYRPAMDVLVVPARPDFLEVLLRSALVNLRWSLAQLPDLIEKCRSARNTLLVHLVSEP
jgi:hypothetical protein